MFGIVHQILQCRVVNVSRYHYIVLSSMLYTGSMTVICLLAHQLASCWLIFIVSLIGTAILQVNATKCEKTQSTVSARIDVMQWKKAR